MKRIRALASFDLSIEETKDEFAVEDRPRSQAFVLATGAAVERICENPGLGRSLGGVMYVHTIVGFSFSIIYEVTDVEICLLYLTKI